MQLIVDSNNEGKRLDSFLTEELKMSRSNISKHIKLGDVIVNGRSVKAGLILKTGDVVEFEKWVEKTEASAENIPLDIYYEDEYIMVINKKSGMVVHPGNGNTSGTLVNALLYYTDNLSDEESDRPGIVHRIDKDTSGLLLITKTNEAHQILSQDFKDKKIKRKYIALVNNVIKEDRGKIDAPIGRDPFDRKKMCVTDKNSKKAVTNFTVLERYKNATLIECILETGRTHQIRVHMAYIGYPIVNDPVYNKRHIINDYGQMLHAKYLGFNHPITHEFLEFTAPTEKEFDEILETFKNS